MEESKMPQAVSAAERESTTPFNDEQLRSLYVQKAKELINDVPLK
jgi:hypothetical protein